MIPPVHTGHEEIPSSHDSNLRDGEHIPLSSFCVKCMLKFSWSWRSRVGIFHGYSLFGTKFQTWSKTPGTSSCNRCSSYCFCNCIIYVTIPEQLPIMGNPKKFSLTDLLHMCPWLRDKIDFLSQVSLHDVSQKSCI